MTWSKKPVEWIENGVARISVPFTWNIPEVYARCVWLRREGYQVEVGGPAVGLMGASLSDVATIGGGLNALWRHNEDAVFTSRGCIRRCKFCAVPILEGDLVEMTTWERKPIVCDNNLLACSKAHFDKVIDSLKGVQGVDFNQGLDARLITRHHAERIGELDLWMVRLAWDDVRYESQVMRAIEILTQAHIPKNKIRVYVLIGFEDTPEDARYRFETLKAMKILPCPQRYNPLDTLVKDSYVGAAWSDRELRRFTRYWYNVQVTWSIPFGEFEG